MSQVEQFEHWQVCRLPNVLNASLHFVAVVHAMVEPLLFGEEAIFNSLRFHGSSQVECGAFWHKCAMLKARHSAITKYWRTISTDSGERSSPADDHCENASKIAVARIVVKFLPMLRVMDTTFDNPHRFLYPNIYAWWHDRTADSGVDFPPVQVRRMVMAGVRRRLQWQVMLRSVLLRI